MTGTLQRVQVYCTQRLHDLRSRATPIASRCLGLRGYPFIFFQEGWGSQVVIQEGSTGSGLSL